MAILFKNITLVGQFTSGANFHTRSVLWDDQHLLEGSSKRTLFSLTRRASGEPTCGLNPTANLSFLLQKGPFFTKTRRDAVPPGWGCGLGTRLNAAAIVGVCSLE